MTVLRIYFQKLCVKIIYMIRMNTASKKKSSVKKAILVRDKLSQFSYTKKRDPKVPFGLGPDSAPLLSKILEDDKLLTESLVSLMAQAKAEGTITTVPLTSACSTCQREKV